MENKSNIRRKVIVSVAPLRVSAFDVLIPIYLEIKAMNQSTDINLLFTRKQVYDDIQKNPVHNAALNKVIDKFVIWKPAKDSSLIHRRLMQLIHGLQLMPLLLKLALARDSILLHTSDLRCTEMRLLHWANKMFGGKTIGHMRAAGDISRLKLYTKNKNKQICQGDIYLYHTDKDLNWIHQAFNQNVIVNKCIKKIGIPIFFDAWLRFANDVADHFLETEFDIEKLRESNVVLMLTSSIAPSKGCNREDFEYLLRSAIVKVRDKVEKALIVIKPHPVQQSEEFDFIKDLKKQYPVYVSYLHHSLFSSHAMLCITIFPTTAAIVPLSFGVPCIEYNRFSGENYTDVLPDGSLNQDFGIPSACNEAELENAIGKVLESKYQIPDMQKFFNHKKELDVFFSA